MTLTRISCAPTMNVGEQIACHFLLNNIADGVLLTNYHHSIGNGTHEHDLVLINQRGIWTLEVKHWGGYIKADQISWQHHSGRRYPSPITSVEIKAKALASTLRNAGFSNVSTVGMVVLTGPDVQLDIVDPRAYKVFRPTSSLIKAVTGRQYLYKSSNDPLTPGQITLIADILVQRTVDPGQKIIGNYRLLQDLGAEAGFQAFYAEHVSFAQRHARVKRYHITNVNSTAELQEAERRFQRDMLALTKVDHHPNIVRAYDFLVGPDSDDTYWLILEWIKGITLHDRLTYEMPLHFDEQLRIVRALVAALEYCHQEGILHRNLNPASIYLADNGAVKLGDFDFARVDDVDATISQLGSPLIVNKYTAPELRANAREAAPHSDLYALGAIWYDMALRPRSNEPLLLSRLDETILPSAAIALLRRLLAPNTDDRPQNAQEVRAVLQSL